MSTTLLDKYSRVNSPSIGDVPDHLYHYTDAAGLIGMLKYGKIWATEYRFLNDKSELTHTEDLTQSVIGKAILSVKTAASRIFCERLIKNPSFSNEYPAFVFSLSEDRDSLSQWRGYARDGQGFTIGLSGPKLLDFSTSDDDALFSIRKVVYDHIKQEQLLDRVISDAIKGIEEECGAAKVISRTNRKIVNSYVEQFKMIVLAHSTYNKHRSFDSEREWRIVSLAEAAIDNDAKVRSRGLELVPYIELKISSDGKLPISSIGIGPGFTNSNQVAAVKYLAQECGYDIDVYAADSPYRRA